MLKAKERICGPKSAKYETGAVLSFPSGSAIKRITAGVKASG